MNYTIRNVVLILIVLVVSGFSIFPPDAKLRKGKDLAGGVTLVYTVDLEGVENPSDTIEQMIDVLKRRVDPKGLFEISFVPQGRNRIEVSMPLPTKDVMRLRDDYTALIDKLAERAIDSAELDRALRLDESDRTRRLKEIAGANQARLALLENAAEAHDASVAARAEYEQIKDDPGMLPEEIEEAQLAAGTAMVGFEEARNAVLATSIAKNRVERMLQLSTEERFIRNDETKDVEKLPSARQLALDQLLAEHPEAADEIQEIVESFEIYAGKRRGLDDTSDLKRLLRGAGVLNFRIAVEPGEHPQEARLRQELRERGPTGVDADDVKWFPLHDVGAWYDSKQEFESLKANPAGFLARRELVGEEHDGAYYALLWDTDAQAMTESDGKWRVTRAYESRDTFGRPSIVFNTDSLGGSLLGELTGAHIGKPMAVLLDNRVYTAPNLTGRITTNGQIVGTFSAEDIDYIRRTLGAGSLQAKLAPAPISEEVVGPQLGADNLRAGFRASWIALIVVALFMVMYYFTSGFVAVFALICNAVMILGAMSLARAAFTLPGIAGIVLTFGMAVDANVLIYERIREELEAGSDLKTAVRLGYQKVMSTIVDANVTNLIVCLVLGYTATTEIRGFAITLGIGIVATLFSSLFITRVIFTILVEHVKIKRMVQLPMVVPGLQRALSPQIDWLKGRPFFLFISTILLGIGIGMVVIQGEEMLGYQFRGGTVVDVSFKDGPDGERIVKSRDEVEGKILEQVDLAPPDSEAARMRDVEIIPVEPQAGGVISDRFKIKTIASDSAMVAEFVSRALEDWIDTQPPLRFTGAGDMDTNTAPVYRVLDPVLGENIDMPAIRDRVDEVMGGVAIVLADLDPPPSRSSLEARLRQIRNQPDFEDMADRSAEVRILQGTEDRVEAAAIIVGDPAISELTDNRVWRTELAEKEWRLVREALTSSTTLAGVQSFDAEIARTFRARAIVAVGLSLLGILIYIWIRFGSLRYSVAAIVALLHDVIAVVGLIALAEIVYHASPSIAGALLIEPFKIDLGLIAALLTIIGYSLNDTIVILDRIRENRGKLAYASRKVVNNSINQTISRTLITSGTTLLAVGIMYVVGGEGIRSFTFALLCGVVVGTYSSIAVASPLVYSAKMTSGPTRSRSGQTGSDSHSEQNELMHA